MITAATARAIWSYDPETGALTWRIGFWRHGISPGGPAGGVDPDTGYLRVRFRGRLYAVHRIAFLIMEGRWPVPTCDHRDLIRTHNQWANLREASYAEQNANTSVRSDNTSGHRGVCWDRQVSKWKVQVRGRPCGHFAVLEDAAAKAVAERARQFGEFAR